MPVTRLPGWYKTGFRLGIPALPARAASRTMWSYLGTLLAFCIVATELSADTTECGKQKLSLRIFGGSTAALGEWPWHVALSFQGEPLCGGTLLSEQWVVTAAHCFQGNKTLKDPASWKAYLAFTTLGGAPDEHTVERNVARILLHEKYTSFINGYDAALLQLSKPVAFNRFIQPVCLPKPGHRFRLGSHCWVTGLEDVRPGDNLTLARPLQKVSITLIGRNTCNCIYNSLERIEISNPVLPGMLCGTDKDGDRGPCTGDSGGPVVCNEDGVWFLAGIVSFSLGCHLPNSPTIFSDVLNYTTWIQTKTNGTSAPVFFANQTISVPLIPDDGKNCTDFLSTKNPGCGIPKVNTTGPGTQVGEWPWSVGLLFQGSHICEGSLISESWVMTAANCFSGSGVTESPDDWTVSLGWPMQEVQVKKISINGAFITPPEGDDIAMVQLSQPVTFNDYLQPACLPFSVHRFRFGTTCWATGHQQKEGSDSSPALQEVELNLIGPNKCNCIYSLMESSDDIPSLLPGMICAAPEEGKTSVCPINTSGPLFCNENGAWFLAGIGSFGGSCGRPDHPAVYTEISAFQEWIKQLTREAYFAPQAISVPPGLDNGSCSDASDSVCGQPLIDERKASNGDAVEGAWPWMASIVQNGDQHCSGVLITRRWVLCEAHCFLSFPVFEDDYIIYLGRSDQTGTSHHEMSRRLKRVVHHPQNRRGAKKNYLVLAEVAPDVIYNDYIRPICLPTENVEFKAGSNCWVVGWGNIQPSGSFPDSDAMKQLNITVLDANQCSCHFEEDDSPNNETAKRMICAGNQQGEGSACLDDSSMPLVCQDSTGSWLLAGFASSQAGCTEPLCPSIYTRASPFAAWIQETAI
ncbi:serine protease 53 isoform X2 [Ambystoma mexicanum]|uniref:serine protease 53 isoform X2 n=1 Tax=Ambystoma mexicanum TaxID=8296 RepID=UPI0037E821FA